MAVDTAFIHLAEVPHELPQSALLGFGAGVGRVASIASPTYVDNADGVRVMSVTMRARLRDGAPSLYCPIEVHDVMVPAAPPAACLMPGIQLRLAHLSPWRGVGAVYNNFVDIAHEQTLTSTKVQIDFDWSKSEAGVEGVLICPDLTFSVDTNRAERQAKGLLLSC